MPFEEIQTSDPDLKVTRSGPCTKDGIEFYDINVENTKSGLRFDVGADHEGEHPSNPRLNFTGTMLGWSRAEFEAWVALTRYTFDLFEKNRKRGY